MNFIQVSVIKPRVYGSRAIVSRFVFSIADCRCNMIAAVAVTIIALL